MATKDFRASQIETSKIIGTGSISGTTVGIAIYSGSVASNREGGVSDSNMLSSAGTDVFLFVSASLNVLNLPTTFQGFPLRSSSDIITSLYIKELFKIFQSFLWCV